MTSTPEDPVELYDLRVVEKNIRKGLITRKDYEQFLESLADQAGKAQPADLAGAADRTGASAPSHPGPRTGPSGEEPVLKGA
jgi:hypothetical protein